MGFDRLIALEDFVSCPDQQGKEVEICTHDTESHMNLYVRGGKHKVMSYACMSPADAKRLRDALIEAYPLPATKAGKKRPHGVQEYKGNGKHDWEPVIGETARLRVPGGWLYQGEYDTVFVPVPEVVGYVV